MNEPHKPLLCLDFDGVLHSYTTPWRGAAIIPDPPVPGAIAWLLAAMEHWEIAIFSARSVPTTGGERSGVQAMRLWLQEWLIKEGLLDKHQAFTVVQVGIQWPVHKPPAVLTIDDRAITFDGDWSLLDPAALLDFKPWNHDLRHPKARGGA